MKIKIRDDNERVDEVKIRIYDDKILIHKYYRTNPISHYQFTYNAEYVELDFEDFKAIRIEISSVKECFVKNLKNMSARVTLTGYIQNITFSNCGLLEVTIVDSINGIHLHKTEVINIRGEKKKNNINVNINFMRLEQMSKVEMISELCLDTLSLEYSDVEIVLTCSVKYIYHFGDYKSKRIFSTDLRFKEYTDNFKQCVEIGREIILIEEIFQCEKLLEYLIQDLI